MDISSYLLGKKAGGGTITETDPVFSASAAAGITATDIENWNNSGTSYSAGTNIEITNAGVINNTIPFTATNDGIKLGAGSVVSTSGIAISKNASASEANTIAIGKGAQALYQQSMALGNGAKTTSRYQLKVGGTDCAIDKITLYTQTGEKDVATEAYVTNAISTAITSALGGSY